MKPIIKAENLSKQYRLGTIGTGTLRQDLSRWMHKVRGKEDPYLKIGETNDRSTKGESDYVWALKDINFEVMPGEVLGIIGKNGAGKSTLLKILSKVTGPTTGRIDYNGRIGSLLEVGTGFHPELTGRENIFLNGAILGMTKHEIRSKLDEIIDFSGCERYIDTPVKRYSSGMTVRLGFAVAAHLEPEILVVDEVLAVGDADFQKKAIEKMQDVSRNHGRTVLFVSHNLAAVKLMCSRGIVLDSGCISLEGRVTSCIEDYLQLNKSITDYKNLEKETDRTGTGDVILSEFNIVNSQGSELSVLTTGEDIILQFKVKVLVSNCKKIDIGFSFHNVYDEVISVLYSSYQDQTIENLNSGYFIISCKIRNFSILISNLVIKGRILVNGIESDWLKIPLNSYLVEMGNYYETMPNLNSENFNCLLTGEWQVSKEV
ncbi:MAG: lipopolysaccharide transport system ATP-binding protein [Sediminicola sp.]|jgi:lipopolysaccharide transport system ATP-binding protein